MPIRGHYSKFGDTRTITNCDSMSSGQVEIQTTPTLIVPVTPTRKYLLIQVHGSQPVFIGPSDVSRTTGFRLDAFDGRIEFISNISTAAFYGVSINAPSTISYMEF